MRKLIGAFIVLFASLSFANINQEIDSCKKIGGDCVNDILQQLSMNSNATAVSSCAAYDNRKSGKVECCQIECHNSKQAVCRDSIYSNNSQVCKLANCSCESRR